ncbi:MAG: peptidylprolyl isomerase [Parabacteroides merdae]
MRRVYRKAKDGADFAMLAKEYSSDAGSAKRGGELPAFGVGEMVEPFEVAAFALNTRGIVPTGENSFWLSPYKVDREERYSFFR